MTQPFDYDTYVTAFNEGDDAALVARFFHEDAVMLTADREVRGRAALEEFLAWAHDGVAETLHPVAVARTGDFVVGEVDIAFSAARDRLDFPLHPMRRGDLVIIKFAASYRLRDERIAVLKTWRWSAGRAIAPERECEVRARLGLDA